MKKIMSEWSTTVAMSKDEAEIVCNLGKGDTCCAFLTCGSTGFECCRMNSLNATIFRRLDEGTMNAKGTGGWENCAWQGEI